MKEINYTNKIGAVELITRKQFLSDRKKANKMNNTWLQKDDDNRLEVYVSVHGYGRKILASYKYTFGGVTDICYGGYTKAAHKDAQSLYYSKA
jgi:hypothetical protein